MTDLNKPRLLVTQRISFKLIVIFFLIILLQIPLFLVKDVIRERQSMQNQAQQSISQRWGPKQYIGAPLVIKNRLISIEGKNKKQLFSQIANTTTASFAIDLQAQKRYLGVFEAAIYMASIEITGEIDTKKLQPLNSNVKLFIPIRDASSIKSLEGVFLNSVKINKQPQIKTIQDTKGFTLDISDINLPPLFTFRIKMNVTGSKSFTVVPNAARTDVAIHSNWTSPSFIGNHLPDSRTINEHGFEAKWAINQLNFSSPLDALATSSASSHYVYEPEIKQFGVKIIIPANTYQVNTRTAKYCLLIILLSFAGLFLAEVFFKIRLHPFQYLLIGVSLTLFYLVLLSLSEYLRFNFAFLLSAFSTITLIAGYCSVVLGQRMRGFYTGILFSVLYGFIFVLVKAEESSLLMGSIGLWIVLALVMYLTRKINWYESNATNQSKI